MKTLTVNIETLCGISNDAYVRTVEDAGNSYAMRYAGGDAECAKHLLHSKAYWNWFKHQWELIDDAFVKAFSSRTSSDDMNMAICRMWLDEHVASCQKMQLPAHLVEAFRASLLADVNEFNEMVDDLINNINTIQ